MHIEKNIVAYDIKGKELGWVCDVMGKKDVDKYPSFLTTERFDGDKEYIDNTTDIYRYTMWNNLSLTELVNSLMNDSHSGLLEDLPVEVEYIGIQLINSLQKINIYFLKKDRHKSNLLGKSVFIKLMDWKIFYAGCND